MDSLGQLVATIPESFPRHLSLSMVRVGLLTRREDKPFAPGYFRALTSVMFKLSLVLNCRARRGNAEMK